jgi:hypothetical protein
VGRTEISGKFVEGFSPNKGAGRHIEHTVVGIELVDRRAATHRVAFAEDLLNVAVKQFVDTVIHDMSPWLLTERVVVPRAFRRETLGSGEADAGAAAGDDGDLSFESARHDPSPCWRDKPVAERDFSK